MEKIYCGAGKTVQGTFGSFDSLNLDVDLLLQHATKAKNGKRYINILVSDRREADRFGNTKKITISQPPEKKAEVTTSQYAPDRDTEDLPF